MELLLTSKHQNKNLYVPWQWPTQSVFPVSEVVLSVPIHINSIFFPWVMACRNTVCVSTTIQCWTPMDNSERYFVW